MAFDTDITCTFAHTCSGIPRIAPPPFGCVTSGAAMVRGFSVAFALALSMAPFPSVRGLAEIKSVTLRFRLVRRG
jgi:hypothetical protein